MSAIIFLGAFAGFVVGVLVSVLISRSTCRMCARNHDAKYGPKGDAAVLENLYKEKAEQESEQHGRDS
jgi:hypothetical protein